MANLVCLLWVFGLGSEPVFCFASLFSLDGDAQIWPGICVSSFVFFVLLVVLCDPICRFPDETTVFHSEFLIRLFYNDFTVICKRRLGYGTSVAAEDLFFFVRARCLSAGPWQTLKIFPTYDLPLS